MAKHHLTHAGAIYSGGGYYAPLHSTNERKGAPINFPTLINLGAPATLDVNGIAEAQAVAGAGNLTLDGALVASGVAVLDVARCVEIDSTDAGDSDQTAIFTGTDAYGETLVETLTFNGTTAVASDKAFKTVTQVAISAALAGNATAGSTDKLGIPYKLANLAHILRFTVDGVNDTYTIVVGDATTATATTGDVRGTVLPNTAADGSGNYHLWMYVADTASKEGLVGITQYGG